MDCGDAAGTDADERTKFIDNEGGPALNLSFVKGVEADNFYLIVGRVRGIVHQVRYYYFFCG